MKTTSPISAEIRFTVACKASWKLSSEKTFLDALDDMIPKSIFILKLPLFNVQ